MTQSDVTFELDHRAKVFSDLSIITGQRRQAGSCKRIIGKFRLYVSTDVSNCDPVYTVLDTLTSQVYRATGTFNKIIIALAKKQW